MSVLPGPRPQQNKYGEELDYSGGFVLNFHYWDCSCEDENYIHSILNPHCWRCGASWPEMSNSREPEVQALRDRMHF